MKKSLLLASASVVLLTATAVYAQDNSSPTGDATASTAAQGAVDNAAAAPEAAAEIVDEQSEEIIITATRRATALSDVPIAVSAVSAETMQNSGANDIRQLNQLAPSLLVSSTGSESNGSARIRGIGTVGDNPGLESSVAVFVDGVYRSRSGIGLNELGEVERVEVLRGP
ncbi:MAG: Plug domain-containing protein, partial [Sphingomonadaceae bacterium]|nr:Plug domain-containing protein [Sphingomonadaceae bacterium]